jgi:hypothetical protein
VAKNQNLTTLILILSVANAWGVGFRDDFNRSDGSLGNSWWTQTDGTIEVAIVDNEVLIAGEQATDWARSGLSRVVDNETRISFDFKANDNFNVHIRVDDAQTGAYIDVYAPPGSFLRYASSEDGNWPGWTDINSSNMIPGQYNTLVLEQFRTTFKLILNEAVVGTITNRNLRNIGQVLISADSAAGTSGSLHIDNVQIGIVRTQIARNPSPESGAIIADTWVNLSWSPGDTAISHDVYFGENLDHVNNGTGGTFQGNQNITYFNLGLPGQPYPDGLVPGRTYYWRVDEVDPANTYKGDVWNFTTRPEISIDYSFDGAISREVLENYLSRAITMDAVMNGSLFYDDQVRMVLNVGAKFLGRAFSSWGWEEGRISELEKSASLVTALHNLDPEIIVQGTIFEIITTSVNNVPIPVRILGEFGFRQERRNFNYDAIRYEDGRYEDRWGSGASVPDISRPETKMWFYYRACEYIDFGYEAIHVGQAKLMDDNDPSHEHWHDILSRIREYASVHGRRHMVLIDGHVKSLKWQDDLLFDFHSFPLCPEETATPQEAVLSMGKGIYGQSGSGRTPSGWYAKGGLPYLVEIDNWGASGQEGQNIGGGWVWGYDEISWFAHQDEQYRNDWLRYAWQWVRDHDVNGFMQMCGSRYLGVPVYENVPLYYANTSSSAMPFGSNQEETIKEIWLLAKPADATPLDVTTPGDIINGVPNNGNWPVNEAPALAIDDNIGTKYLHFNGDFEPDLGSTGFRVTPSDSQNIVTGLTFTTANDYPGRDPIAFELYGSNISIDGPYTLIFSGEIVDFRQRQAWPRFAKNETPISFDNDIAYDHYQVLFMAIRGPVGGSVNSMQIAEVELLRMSVSL